MLKLFVVASLALATANSVASAEPRKEAPAPSPPQQQTDKTLPTPDEVARWMTDTIGHILEPVETIVRPQSP